MPMGVSMPRRTLIACAAAIAAALALAPSAGARAFTPPGDKIFHGVSDTGHAGDYRSFVDLTRAHSAVMQDFFHWGVPVGTGALQRWRHTRTRGVLSLSTAPGGQSEVIDPKGIASGRGDDYILSLNGAIAKSHQIVYIRLMPEMNGSWNPYSAFNSDGSSRGTDHSTRWFKKAWKRFALIVRGGSRRSINKRLRKQHLPRIYRARSNHDKIYKRKGVDRKLPKPKIALMWVPQTSGSPNIAANRPARYWPGARYVDWVGADAYAKFSNSTLWNNLNRFYRRFDGKPFVIGEYAPWDADPGGAFVSKLFNWAEDRRRARMLIYYRSVSPTNEFNLQFYPDALSVVRKTLNRSRYMGVAPELKR